MSWIRAAATAQEGQLFFRSTCFSLLPVTSYLLGLPGFHHLPGPCRPLGPHLQGRPAAPAECAQLDLATSRGPVRFLPRGIPYPGHLGCWEFLSWVNRDDDKEAS